MNDGKKNCSEEASNISSLLSLSIGAVVRLDTSFWALNVEKEEEISD